MKRIMTAALFSSVLSAILLAQGPAATRPAIPFTLSGETTAITGPLNADGTVDYVAALNEKYSKGVTPENNGFVLWLNVVGAEKALDPKIRDRVLKLCGVIEGPPGAQPWEGYQEYMQRMNRWSPTDTNAPYPYDELTGAQRDAWKPQDHPDLAAFLKAREGQLDRAVEAFNRPQWWMPVVSLDAWTTLASMPSLGLARDVATTLCARATLRAGTGDIEGFVSDITAVRKFARQLIHSYSLVVRLVATAIDALAINVIAGVAAKGILTEAQCRQLAKSCADLGPLPSSAEAVELEERWQLLDVLASIATGRAGILHLTSNDQVDASKFNLDRSAIDWNTVLKLVNRTMDENVRAMSEPSLAKMRAAMVPLDRQRDLWNFELPRKDDAPDFSRQDGETRDTYSQRVARSLIALLLPRTSHIEELRRRADQGSRMLPVIVAAAGYKAKTGDWPGRLAELVPAYLAKVPNDDYSRDGSSEVHYLLRATGPCVYSVGPNGVDDGGVSNSSSAQDDIALGAK